MNVPKSWPKANLSQNARIILEKRYLKIGETPEDMFYRVAKVVAGVEEQKFGKDVQVVTREFYNMMVNLEFMPNSPTLMNAGRELGQLSACFVLPVYDSMEEIFDSIKNAAIIHKSGGGTGFSFSRLRPKNSMVRSTGGVASGPVSFMKVFNAATEAVKQGGTRRGANMGILRVDHPDILEFISCKEDNSEITNFNISVGITDAFMDLVKREANYNLIDPCTGTVTGTLSAVEVFNNIVDHSWRNGEPGVIFLDKMNADNPTPHIGEIEASNPCSEQPLLPNEACNLGSINLKSMVCEKDGKTVIDWKRLSDVTRLAVHFLDNVIDVNQYPLPAIDAMVKGNRKIGLGVMGFADVLIMLQMSYASEEAVECAEEIMDFIRAEAREESQRLAQERGAFPNYEGSKCPELRNATLTTIAPTGTISMICGVSGGVEPIFAVAYTKTVMDGIPFIEVNPLFEKCAKQYGFHSEELMQKIAERGTALGLPEVPRWVQEVFTTAQEIEPEWHVKMQASFQKFTDNAVSKTINFPSKATREDVAKAYQLAYDLNCKGLTVYRDGSREGQVLTTGTSLPKINTEEVQVIKPRPRPDVTTGTTEKIKIGCGNLYVSVNSDEKGICEVFTNTGRAGGCSSQSEATARLISVALRSGVSEEDIIEQIQGIRCPACVRREGVKVTSCPDAIARIIKKQIGKGGGEDVKPAIGVVEVSEAKKCPECGMPINHESGCVACVHCGYSKCM
ncbi:vitamin B12-dependent ribonucleotide reductase [Desulfosporosinus sp. Sb-LF]|uniref:vitamin B12-dependent ribonucleotide reductase n=1 Tax=Desulfosporosinus sp. Sb-LF TaxID=2560027 RepID=UPI00107F0E2A|nr:vitamin B12-dependent ribonucleotide reductase [Desulfosporosinus sp. Sb-LF]TGE33353.1 vitamin B12-dependent ribonucleotide reductase [Desulfosporosinus sp. Sb-LF]